MNKGYMRWPLISISLRPPPALRDGPATPKTSATPAPSLLRTRGTNFFFTLWIREERLNSNRIVRIHHVVLILENLLQRRQNEKRRKRANDWAQRAKVLLYLSYKRRYGLDGRRVGFRLDSRFYGTALRLLNILPCVCADHSWTNSYRLERRAEVYDQQSKEWSKALPIYLHEAMSYELRVSSKWEEF